MSQKQRRGFSVGQPRSCLLLPLYLSASAYLATRPSRDCARVTGRAESCHFWVARKRFRDPGDDLLPRGPRFRASGLWTISGNRRRVRHPARVDGCLESARFHGSIRPVEEARDWRRHVRNRRMCSKASALPCYSSLGGC